MKHTGEGWSDEALEAFLDGALEGAEAEGLGAALREDPALRERLAAIRRRDELMLEAMMEGGAACRVTGRGWSWGAFVLAAAACVAVVGGVWGWAESGRGEAAPIGPAVVHRTEDDGGGAGARAYDPVPVVVAVKLRARGAARGASAARDQEPATEWSGEGAAPVERRLAAALAAGDVAAAVALVDGAESRAQEGAYRQIGELMRSASVAERVLDSMAPAQQLAACRMWAEDPRLRTVVFPRLALLAEGGRVGPELAAVVEAMAQRDELRPWVRSYGLAAVLDVDGGPRG